MAVASSSPVGVSNTFRTIGTVLLCTAAVTVSSGALAVDPPVAFGSVGVYGPADFYVTDLTTDAAGNVYLVDRYYGHVKKYAADGTELLEFSDPSMPLPRTVAVDAAGRVLVGLPNRGEIFVFSPTAELLDVWTGFPSVADLHVDVKGRVLLTTGSSTSPVDEVIVLDGDGEELFRFGSFGAGPGQFNRPYGIYSGPDASIVVTDLSNNRVQKFAADGTFLFEFGGPGSGPGGFFQHKGVAVDSQGNIFVADRGNDRIQKFDADGNFLLEWGERGHDPGQFFEMEGITVAPDDSVWVAGYQQHDVPRFTNDGVYLDRFFGVETGPGEFASMRGIAVSNDKLFIVDYWSHWVQVFDAWSGDYLYQFGERDGGAATVFNFPNAVTAGPDGDIYVTGNVHIRRMHADGTFVDIFDRASGAPPSSPGLVADSTGRLYQSDIANKRINVYDTATGTVLDEWAGPGANPGQLNTPGELDLSTDQQQVLIADTKNSRVQVFSFGGDYVYEWATAQRPIALGVDHQRGLVYAGSSQRVTAYDFDGVEQFAWGSAGSGPGQFNGIYSIAVTADAVFVSEIGNSRTQRFIYPSAFEGQPRLTPGNELAIHLWRNAPDPRLRKSRPNWHLRLTGGASAADYSITVSGLAAYKALAHSSMEAGDTLATQSGSFTLSGQINADIDGADFYLAQAATLSIDAIIDGVPVAVPVLVGGKSIDGGTSVVPVPASPAPAAARRNGRR